MESIIENKVTYFKKDSNEPVNFPIVITDNIRRYIWKDRFINDIVEVIASLKDDGKTIYLIYMDDSIFITSCILELEDVARCFLMGRIMVKESFESLNVGIHEYASFESAYAVALGMKETHELCYDK